MRTLLVISICAITSLPGSAQVLRGRAMRVNPDSAAAGVTVRLLDSRGAEMAVAQAGEDGAFLLRAARGGTFRLSASGGGLRDAVSRDMELGTGDSLEVRFRLAADTALANPLQLIASSRRPRSWQADFARRLENEPYGLFLTREEIGRRESGRASAVLATIPGLTAGPGGEVRARGACSPAAFLDGIRLAGGASAVDAWVRPSDLEAVEAYLEGQPPTPFRGTSSQCGVVILWTRSGG
jgi:hypothetical protein